MKSLKTIAKEIKIARARHDYTLETLSEISGVGITTLTHLENGIKKKYNYSTFAKIEKALDIKILD